MNKTTFDLRDKAVLKVDREKIDGIVAGIMGLGRALVHRSGFSYFFVG